MDGLGPILQSHSGTAEDTKDKLLGAAFVLVDKNGILFQGGSGQQTFASGSPQYGPETVTWVASMTKLFTTISILQLVEKGVVSLDEDIRDRVSTLAKVQILRGIKDNGVPILEDNSRPITLRHLLTHTSGLPYDIIEPDVMQWAAHIGRKNINLTWTLEGFTTPLIFAPGDSWVYGTNLDWTGQVLEKITGQRLSEYMDEHIFKPLGLQDTTFYPARRPDLQGRIAEFGYRSAATEGSLVPGPAPIPAEYEVESGGAGLYSTAADYAKVLAAILKGDVLLKKEATDLLFAPQLTDAQRKALADRAALLPDAYSCEYPPGHPADYSCGGMINLEDLPGKRRKGSVMWSGFANGHWWIDAETGIAGVLLTTVMADPIGDPVVKKLYHELETAVYSNLSNGVA